MTAGGDVLLYLIVGMIGIFGIIRFLLSEKYTCSEVESVAEGIEEDSDVINEGTIKIVSGNDDMTKCKVEAFITRRSWPSLEKLLSEIPRRDLVRYVSNEIYHKQQNYLARYSSSSHHTLSEYTRQVRLCSRGYDEDVSLILTVGVGGVRVEIEFPEDEQKNIQVTPTEWWMDGVIEIPQIPLSKGVIEYCGEWSSCPCRYPHMTLVGDHYYLKYGHPVGYFRKDYVDAIRGDDFKCVYRSTGQYYEYSGRQVNMHGKEGLQIKNLREGLPIPIIRAKMGDKEYRDIGEGKGVYLNSWEYSLYSLFVANKGRFKPRVKPIGCELQAGQSYLLDTETGGEFFKDYKHCGMGTKVTPEGWEFLTGVVVDHYTKCKERWTEIARIRNERSMLKLYCNCEEKGND